jgi:hypothetical protein
VSIHCEVNVICTPLPFRGIGVVIASFVEVGDICFHWELRRGVEPRCDRSSICGFQAISSLRFLLPFCSIVKRLNVSQ